MQKAEKIGLGVAAAGHVALIIILSLRFVNAPNSAFKPRPVEVTITDEIALEAGAPDPAMIAPAPSVAPEIGLPSEPDYPAPAPLPERVETPAPTPAPAPKPVAKPAPAPKPAAKVQPQPKPKPAAKASAKPTPQSTPKPTPKSTPAPKPAATPAATPARGSRLGNDFLKGIGDKPSASTSQAPVAAKASAAVTASLRAEVLRQLKPHWQALAPTGADAELLRSVLRFKLDRTGRLTGTPQVVATTGRTASNAPQVGLHAERAIAAVRRAAPFTLPEKYYDAWNEMEIGFDKRLSQ